MKAAILSEFSAVKNVLLQQFVIYLVVGVFVGIGMGSATAMVACISAMAPILMVFTFAGYDSMNGWERFRATLPVSRDALVIGRYANVLLTSLTTLVAAFIIALLLGQLVDVLPIDAETAQFISEEVHDPAMIVGGGLMGMCAMLLMTAILQPFILRYGMTKAMRWVPVGLMLAFFMAVLILPQVIDAPTFLVDFIASSENPDNLPLLTMALTAIALGVYAISCAAAMALYRKKEL